MKNIFIRAMAVLMLAGLSSMMPSRSEAQASVSFQVFYDQMSPYGSWVNYSNYGYVWIPTGVPAGFRPYSTGGHWVYTDDGWAWVSDYAWGWAPFHYGNWVYDDTYGWMWIPGYEWAPAWVTWGEYGDDYCWAPIGPQVDIGVSFGTYRPPAYCWTFVPRAYITSPNIHRYYVNRTTNVTVVNHITVINNVNRGGHAVFMRGPQAQNVEKYTHANLRPVQIREAGSPGRGRVENGSLALYRPTVRHETGARPAPSKVEDIHRLRPAALPATNRNVHTNNAHPAASPKPAVTHPAEHAARPVTHPAPHPNHAPRPNPVPVNPPPHHTNPPHHNNPRPENNPRPVQQHPVQQHPVQQPHQNPRPANRPAQPVEHPAPPPHPKEPEHR